MIIFQFFESERLVLIDNESDGVEAKSDLSLKWDCTFLGYLAIKHANNCGGLPIWQELQ
ncbi:hypothetical protein [Lacticaseibacillus paracasei]|jgi:hypothetical protein